MGKIVPLKKRKKRRKKSGGVFTKILVSLITIFLLAAATAIYFDQEAQMAELQRRNDELSEQADEALQTKNKYENLLEKTDSLEYIERIAREKLGMVKPGEVIFTD